MKARNPFISVSGAALTVGLLTAALALPASAAPGDTTAFVIITAGTLSISVPADAGSLGSAPNTVGGVTISGPLGQVQVLDARGAVAGSGWIASAISTAFTPPTGPAIPATSIGYTVGVITKVGTATYVAMDPPILTGVAPVVVATDITGNNSATWNPLINIRIPGGMAPGVYSGFLTHSVL